MLISPTLWIGIALILLGLTLTISAIILIYCHKIKRQNEKDRLKDEKQHLIEQWEQEKLHQRELDDEKVKTFENRVVDLDLRINEKQDQLRNLNTQIDEYENRLYQISIALFNINDKYQEVSILLHGEEQSRADLLALRNSLEEALEALKPQISVITGDLEDLKNRKRLAILNQNQLEEGLWELSLTKEENKLISILEEIKTNYPQLKIDIATIEWRKIWWPKAQELCNQHNLSKVKGIYRLILKDNNEVLKDNNEVCYIGQAVNIQERWYQHIKKMIGAEVAGNERLYDYRPDDFYWSVVEENPKDMNGAEHYWIEYFGCKEKGLNKKA